MICYSRVPSVGQNFIKSQYELFFSIVEDEKPVIDAVEKELAKHGYTFITTPRPSLIGKTVVLTIQKIKGQKQTPFPSTVIYVRQMFYLVSTTLADLNYELSNQTQEISVTTFKKK